MALWLKQAVLVLLTVAEAAMAGCSQEINLSSPGDPLRKERVNTSARSLKFLCDIPTKSSRYRVTFYFRDSNTKNISHKCSTAIYGNLNAFTTSPKKKQTNQTDPNMKCYNKTWEIQNITRENNGFYSCEIHIEIPVLNTTKSREVEVLFVPSINNPPSENKPSLEKISSSENNPLSEKKTQLGNNPISSLWLPLGLSLLAVVILMVLGVVNRRACLRNREEPIYVNTNLKPSPRSVPQRDQLKLAEPYQNMRTPSPTRSNKVRTNRPRP
ncbi:hypothetical protein FQA47_019566 [Oryzias melastigma]|uniref:Uncharacterized protein n=1 Tax=Oryzias melastigma TaxID=30732 RepID=A0A834FBC8_ORYME|nr:hypothetical protein FQA47_019566 [Oryzias melastigma]